MDDLNAGSPEDHASPGKSARATIRDVAAAAGVSKSLVSLAFKEPERVSERRREAILKTAARLGYRPNMLARSLATDGMPFVAIVVVNLHNPLFAAIADAVRAELDLHGEYGLITAATLPGYPGKVTSYGRLDTRVVTMVKDLRPKALIIIGTAEGSPLFDDIPTVYASAAPGPGSYSIHVDDAVGMRLAVEHLVAAGRQRIGFVGGKAGPVSEARERAYRVLAAEHDVTPRSRPAGFSESEGRQAAAELLAQPAGHRPDAIIAVNDMAAIGALTAVDEAGLRVARDVAVVGFDNSTLASMPRIDLTSVDPHNDEIGRLAARTALTLMRGDEPSQLEQVITPHLVIRGSSAG
ncbi:LacI family DNA-binding transcriptional regulator [Galactobacter sp.]|uniref:LacI family DNA-binding transcriptional regulator n=1 Tax=Galactobacter sp. TaxID=2676125 RepID=UPI0025B8DC6E|nr:LacI family DNA-binding transcriptional regulator [Galactobacter sp.]